MPTYDYLCSACGHRFEEFQSMSAKSLRKCPACKKSALERLIGAGAGVIFKGSGFYTTDYRGDSYSQDAKKDSSADTAAKSTAAKSTAAKTTTGKETGGKETAAKDNGSCAPTCGTDKAPTGCKMPKKKD